MFVIIFIEAVIISAFFDQQERRHGLELQVEYEKLGDKVPDRPPKLPMIESLANIVVGLIMAELGSIGLWSFLSVLRTAGHIMAKAHPSGQIDFMSALLAGGIALMILGGKSVRANLRHKKKVQQLSQF